MEAPYRPLLTSRHSKESHIYCCSTGLSFDLGVMMQDSLQVKLIMTLTHLLAVAYCCLKFLRFGFRTAVHDTKSSRPRAASPRALPCPGCLHRCQRTSTIHLSAAWTSRIYWPCTDTWTVSVGGHLQPAIHLSQIFTKKVIDYNFVYYSISM